MNDSSSVTFYCKGCNMMLNEKCFKDVKTGELKSICSMCAMMKKSILVLNSLTLAEEQSLDCKLPKATKGIRSAGVRSSSHFEKKCSCTTIPALQSVATCVTPSKNETFYMAKLIYHPYYSTTRTVSATQDGNYPIFNLSSQKCVSTRSPSSSTLEASETYSFPGGLANNPNQEIRV